MAQHRQVTYNLATWSAGQRGELVAMLTGRGISHDWRTATTLVVTDLVESEVDTMIGVVHGEGDLVVDEDGTKRPHDPSVAAGAPAPLLLRAAAFVLDTMMISVALWIASGASIDGSASTAAGPVGAGVLALYFVGFVAVCGQTPGKMAVRLRIVDVASGDRPGPVQAGIRFVVPNLVWVIGLSLGRFSPIDRLWEPVVYGTVLFNAQRRGLHDLAARTLVVGRRP